MIGNIGGYVGLLLGASVLQVPHLLIQLSDYLMKFYMRKTGQPATIFNENVDLENSKSPSGSMLSLRTCASISEIVKERRVKHSKQNDLTNFLNDIMDNQI